MIFGKKLSTFDTEGIGECPIRVTKGSSPFSNGSLKHSVFEPKVSEGKTKDFSQTNTLDFFDIKPNKKIIQSKIDNILELNRQHPMIKVESITGR